MTLQNVSYCKLFLISTNIQFPIISGLVYKFKVSTDKQKEWSHYEKEIWIMELHIILVRWSWGGNG